MTKGPNPMICAFIRRKLSEIHREEHHVVMGAEETGMKHLPIQKHQGCLKEGPGETRVPAPLEHPHSLANLSPGLLDGTFPLLGHCVTLVTPTPGNLGVLDALFQATAMGKADIDSFHLTTGVKNTEKIRRRVHERL